MKHLQNLSAQDDNAHLSDTRVYQLKSIWNKYISSGLYAVDCAQKKKHIIYCNIMSASQIQKEII